MNHAECVGLISDAYEAKDGIWQTAEAVMNSTLDSADAKLAAEAANSEAIGARLAAQKYINALADLCEALR